MITVKKMRKVPIYPNFYYALADKNMRQCTEWLECRESLQNRMSDNILNGRIKALRLLISGEGKNRLGMFDFNKRIKNLEEFLNLAGRKVGAGKIRISEVRDSADKKKVFMIQSDDGWIHAPPLFSLLSLYARIGIFHRRGDSLEKTVRDFMHKHYKDFCPEEKKGKWKKRKDLLGRTFGLKYRIDSKEIDDFDRDACEDELESCEEDSRLLRYSSSFRSRLMTKGVQMFPKPIMKNYEIGDADFCGICDSDYSDWKEMEREYDYENEEDD